jgi:hypothetical protein
MGKVAIRQAHPLEGPEMRLKQWFEPSGHRNV